MKHLKSFHENISEDSNLLYREIDGFSLNNSVLIINPKNVKQISDRLLPEYKIELQSEDNSWARIFMVDKGIGAFHFDIFELEDEYFEVLCYREFDKLFRNLRKMYLCDGLEGLLKLLEDMEIISKEVNESLDTKSKLYREINYGDFCVDKNMNPIEVKIDPKIEGIIKPRLTQDFEIDPSTFNILRIKISEDYLDDLPSGHDLRDFYFDIVQLEDEYFDVEYLNAKHPQYQKTRFNSEYIRCDGIEGLLQLLEDENIIS